MRRGHQGIRGSGIHGGGGKRSVGFRETLEVPRQVVFAGGDGWLVVVGVAAGRVGGCAWHDGWQRFCEGVAALCLVWCLAESLPRATIFLAVVFYHPWENSHCQPQRGLSCIV